MYFFFKLTSCTLDILHYYETAPFQEHTMLGSRVEQRASHWRNQYHFLQYFPLGFLYFAMFIEVVSFGL